MRAAMPRLAAAATAAAAAPLSALLAAAWAGQPAPPPVAQLAAAVAARLRARARGEPRLGGPASRAAWRGARAAATLPLVRPAKHVHAALRRERAVQLATVACAAALLAAAAVGFAGVPTSTDVPSRAAARHAPRRRWPRAARRGPQAAGRFRDELRDDAHIRQAVGSLSPAPHRVEITVPSADRSRWPTSASAAP